MSDRARDDSGKFVAAPVADGSQSEAPIIPAMEPGEKPRASGLTAGATGLDTKQAERRAEIDAKQDNILARILGTEFKDKTPHEREEVAAVEAKEQSDAAAKATAAEAKRVSERASTPDRQRAEKAVELLGIKRSVIDKMEDGELFELASHREKVDRDVNQRLAKLSEYETKQKTAAANGTQPRSEEPAGQGLNLAEAAKPLLDALMLDESALPAVEKFAQSILGASDARIAALEAAISGTSEAFANDIAGVTRSQLVNRFPDLQKDEVWTRIEERMNVLAQTGYYAEAAPTMRGRMEKLMVDACKLESLDESKAKAEVDRAALSKAKANGDVSTSSAGNTARGQSRDQQVLAAAKRAIEKFG